MPAFRYSAYTTTGHIERGQIDAPSGEAALGQLAARGLMPFETREIRQSRWNIELNARRRIAIDDIAYMTRSLATLLEAEIPVDETLRLLREQATNNRINQLVDRLLAEVTSGAPLSTALERQGSDIPRVMTSLVRAGEARGTLGPTLAEIAKLLEGQAEVRARIRSALVYPLVLAGVAMVTLGIVLTVLFPSLLQLFEDSQTEPPAILALARDISNLLSKEWALLLPASIAIVVLAVVLVRQAVANGTVERLLVQLPVIGDLRRKLAIAVFTRTLGSLIGNGVQLLEALKITATVVPSVPLAKHLQATAQSLKEGNRLSTSLAADSVIPPAVIRLITIGEEASRLDTMLLHLADMYDRDASRALERGMTLLSPLITVAVGFFVGGIILSVMQAVMSINTLALR